ncbi:MAG: GNAT family N-acetyltransferase [Candidatus Riflebacteria bacterium]|nr:GNAT family N-acetyltransferase [Candidatus Riflebacteria bacterium]
MAIIEIPKAETHSIYLRMFSLDDTEKVFQMSIENGIKEWIPDQVYNDQTHAKEVLEFLIQQYDDCSGPDKIPIVFGVCLKSNNELIGHVGLSPYSENAEIGYAIEKAQQNKGFATEAILAMTKWAFRKFNLPFILGIVSAENIGSCRALEKANFALENEERKILHNKNTLVRTYKSYMAGVGFARM